ncbi:hypothetical protein SDC9_95484 [bioreactor metagenome]|uniref:Uncharacterized protein n=1 Tax=bioreactor metagenome TaxID=1076179 RepID=A0A645A6R9_9ZZZZ
MVVDEQVPLLFQFFILCSIFQLRLFDFLDLESQQVDSLDRFFLVRLQFDQLLACIHIFGISIEIGRFDFSQFIPGKLIQQVDMFLRIHQFLMLVLPVDIDQRFAYFTQSRNCHDCTVDAGNVFAVSGKFPLQQNLVPVCFDSV